MGDIFHALWRTSVDDVVQKFGLFYEATAGGGAATSAQSAAVAIQAAQLTELRDILAVEARVESLYVRKVTGTTIPAWRGNLQNAVGTNSGTNAISAQNCLLINLRNTAGLLKRSGRIFISGCPTSVLSSGVWASIFLTGDVQAFIDKLQTIPAGGTDGWAGQLRVMKRVTNGVPVVPPTPIAVDAIDATDTLGTQHVRRGELTGYRV